MSVWTKKEMESLNPKHKVVESGYLCNGKPTNKTYKFVGKSNIQIGLGVGWYECDYCERTYNETGFLNTHSKSSEHLK